MIQLKNASAEDILNELAERLKAVERAESGERNSLLRELTLVNKKLLESETLKTNFLSNIRNEIVNPLTAALELSGNICSQEMDLHQIKQLSAMIHREILQLNFQLRNILCSAAIEAGEIAFSHSSLQPSVLIRSVLNTLKTEIQRKDIHLDYINHIQGDYVFYSDAEKTNLILENIISNAVRFNRPAGKVTVKSSITGEGLHVVVSDTGIGMSEADKQRIFDRFTQIEEGVTKSFPGHGLGLSVTKALLELLGGQITIESQLNEGTCFTIVVPKADNINGSNDFSQHGNDLLFSGSNDEIF